MGRTMASEVSEEEVLRLLAAAIEKEGSQSAWARKYKVSRPHLNKVLHRRKVLGPSRIASLLAPLKIRIAFVKDK